MDISILFAALSNKMPFVPNQATASGIAQDAQDIIDFSTIINDNKTIVSAYFERTSSSDGREQYTLDGIGLYDPGNSPQNTLPPVRSISDTVIN